MSARKAKKGSRRRRRWWESAWLGGILLLALGVYLGLSLTGPSTPWWLALRGEPTGDLVAARDNPGGPVGAVMSLTLRLAFGAAWCWFFPLLLLVLALHQFAGRRRSLVPRVRRVLPFWLASVAWIAQPAGLLDADRGAAWGGLLGVWLARGFHFLFGLWGGRIFLTFFLLVGLTVLLRPWLSWLERIAAPVADAARTVASAGAAVLAFPLRLGRGVAAGVRRVSRRGLQSLVPAGDTADETAFTGQDSDEIHQRERRLHNIEQENRERGDFDHDDRGAGAAPGEPVEPAAGNGAGGGARRSAARANDAGGRSGGKPVKKTPRKTRKTVVAPTGPLALPGRDLLVEPGPAMNRITPAELDASADLLEDTLRSFGVEGEVKDVRPGPVVTTFEYQPAAGIRVNQIVQRSNDLALAMRARSIRMEAPIPGKAAVGIEIPNPVAQTVYLKEVLDLTNGQARPPLDVVLGKDVTGQPVTIDIAQLPHLLVAGSTGSGKSVCLNCVICNLLLHNDPTRLRLVLIDPKMLELSVYNGLPHLLLPVVTDPKEALKAMKWLVAQMDYRYRALAKCSVRNIAAYNDKVAAGGVLDDNGEAVTEPMPYYLAIVDELADLMIQLGQEMEMPITRLAQKARAVGIHLILATQRPSVDVLTGVIKANIPCRIAFRVIQKNDSRTILDMNGAEQLLGHGDMLYLKPGRALPIRVHGAFIDVTECEAITEYWKGFGQITEEISLDEHPAGGGMYTGDDDLYEEAKRIVVLHQSGSTSLLQRRLRVGYTRAGRLMDMLEEAGVVGPFTGSKARDVLLRTDDLPELAGDTGGQADGAEA